MKKISLFILLTIAPHIMGNSSLFELDPDAFGNAGEQLSKGIIRGLNNGLEQAPTVNIEALLTKVSLFFVGTACSCYGIHLLNKSIKRSLFPQENTPTIRPTDLNTQSIKQTSDSNRNELSHALPSRTIYNMKAGIIGTAIGSALTLAGLISIAKAGYLVDWLQS